MCSAGLNCCPEVYHQPQVAVTVRALPPRDALPRLKVSCSAGQGKARHGTPGRVVGACGLHLLSQRSSVLALVLYDSHGAGGEQQHMVKVTLCAGQGTIGRQS